MNTRLQVEHPVTEAITGIDLVEQQIRIARGEALSFRQEDLQIEGHALELRIYAEDPTNNFLPSIGQLEQYRIPTGEGVRLDSGYEEGMEIPIYYDPMIAKLVTYGDNRAQAISRMQEAISNFHIKGIATTLPFGLFVCEHPAFRSGNINTHFVKEHFSGELLKSGKEEEAQLAAQLALKLLLDDQAKVRVADDAPSNWKNRKG